MSQVRVLLSPPNQVEGRMARPFFVSRAWLHTSMYAPGALALESTHPSSLLLGLAYSFGRIGCPFFVFSLGYVCPYTRPSRSSVAIAYDRHRYHPAKESGWLRPLGGRRRYHPAKGSGWLRPLGGRHRYHPAKGSGWLRYLLPDFRRECRSMQQCNSRSYPRNSGKIFLSRVQITSLQIISV